MLPKPTPPRRLSGIRNWAEFSEDQWRISGTQFDNAMAKKRLESAASVKKAVQRPPVQIKRHSFIQRAVSVSFSLTTLGQYVTLLLY